MTTSRSSNSGRYEERWDIYTKDSRKLRIGLRDHQNVIFIDLTIFKSDDNKELIPLTFSEFLLIPKEEVLKKLSSSEAQVRDILNGKRKISIRYSKVTNGEESSLLLNLLKFSGDSNEWKVQHHIKITMQEFQLFSACIPEIIEEVGKKMFNNIELSIN